MSTAVTTADIVIVDIDASTKEEATRLLAERLLAAGRITEFHACSSDRGTPGEDHVDWVGIVKALKEGGNEACTRCVRARSLCVYMFGVNYHL